MTNNKVVWFRPAFETIPKPTRKINLTEVNYHNLVIDTEESLIRAVSIITWNSRFMNYTPSMGLLLIMVFGRPNKVYRFEVALSKRLFWIGQNNFDKI